MCLRCTAEQGLNFVVANLLRWLGEEEAFWTLIQIVEVLQPRDYYTNMVRQCSCDTIRCERTLSPQFHPHQAIG